MQPEERGQQSQQEGGQRHGEAERRCRVRAGAYQVDEATCRGLEGQVALADLEGRAVCASWMLPKIEMGVRGGAVAIALRAAPRTPVCRGRRPHRIQRRSPQGRKWNRFSYFLKKLVRANAEHVFS